METPNGKRFIVCLAPREVHIFDAEKEEYLLTLTVETYGHTAIGRAEKICEALEP